MVAVASIHMLLGQQVLNRCSQLLSIMKTYNQSFSTARLVTLRKQHRIEIIALSLHHQVTIRSFFKYVDTTTFASKSGVLHLKTCWTTCFAMKLVASYCKTYKTIFSTDGKTSLIRICALLRRKIAAISQICTQQTLQIAYGLVSITFLKTIWRIIKKSNEICCGVTQFNCFL